MIKKCIWLCCLYSGILGASPAGDELKALLEPVTSMKATFKQTVTNEKGIILQSTQGLLWLQKPRQFRWEIKGRDARLIVSDGKKIWDYDEDLEQVSIRSLSKDEHKLPIFFLSGDVETLEQDFEIKNCTPERDTCFELIPKESPSKDEQSGIFQSIQLKFKNRVLVSLETVDQLGQRTVFSFKEVQTNVAIPVTQFQFVPPKGVDVIGAK